MSGFPSNTATPSPTPPTTPDSETHPNKKSPSSVSRYPPGVQEILDRPEFICEQGSRSDRWSSSSSRGEAAFRYFDVSLYDNVACGSGSGGNRDITPPPDLPIPSSDQDEALSNRSSRRSRIRSRRVSMASQSSVKRGKMPLYTRNSAIYRIEQFRESLCQLKTGMTAVVVEYFPNRILRHIVEVPSFRQLCNGIDRLNVTLQVLQTSLRDFSIFPYENEIQNLMQDIRPVMDSTVELGESLVVTWTRREGGQRVGVPLEGQNWRLRRNLVHDSDPQIENLAKVAKAANATIRQELEIQQQSSRRPKIVSKVVGWFKSTSAPELTSKLSQEVTRGDAVVDTAADDCDELNE